MLYLQQFGDIASFYSSTQCCGETWCWSHILSFYVIYFWFLPGRLSLIFLNDPRMCLAQIVSCFSCLGFTGQPLQGECIRHTSASYTAAPPFQVPPTESLSLSSQQLTAGASHLCFFAVGKGLMQLVGKPHVSGVNVQKASLGVSE